MSTKKTTPPPSDTTQENMDCPARSLIRQYIAAMHRDARVQGSPHKLQQKIEQEVLSFFS